jgi:alpha-L-rhamnosidase
MNFLARSGRASVPPYTKPGNPMLDDTILSPTMIGFLQLSQWGDHLSLSSTYHGRSGLPLSISTAFYYHDVQVMEKIATVLGKADHAAKFHALAIEIMNAFNDRFLNKEKGYYDDGSQSAQAWPLFFGLVPAEWVSAVQRVLIDDIIKTHNGHPTTGYVGTKYMIDQLTNAGRQDIVWQMLMNTDFPSWNYSLRDGRSTITERWDDGGSQNHVVLGAAIDPWFYTVLAGIRADDNYPGYRQFSIQPYIPDSNLDWVDASVNTAYGNIASSWKKTKSGLQFDFEIPVNTTAIVYLPVKSAAVIRESGHQINKSNSVSVISMQDSQTVLKLGSGTYHFEIKYRN